MEFMNVTRQENLFFFISLGSITGEDLAFIYPDMNTVFKGQFENFVMMSAREVEVLNSGCDDYGMMTVTQYSEADSSGPVFYYKAPTNISFGAGPSGVRDPFERKWLTLGQSAIPNSGEGNFLRKYPWPKHMSYKKVKLMSNT